MIEMSTVGPATVSRLATLLPPGTGLLDAPVLGSLLEVEAGALGIFVGGSTPGRALDARALRARLAAPRRSARPGRRGKLVVNSTLFGTVSVLGEAVALAQGLGLSKETTFDVLATSSIAGQAERRREAIETGEYPKRFPLSLGLKDADLIAEAAAASGVDLRVAAAARSWLAEADEAGWGDRDYAEVLAWILGRR